MGLLGLKMKINIELDITPEEARKLIGLPDYSQMQELWLNKLRSNVKSSAKSTNGDTNQFADIDPIIKNSESVGASVGEFAQEAFGKFLNGIIDAAITPNTKPEEIKKNKE